VTRSGPAGRDGRTRDELDERRHLVRRLVLTVLALLSLGVLVGLVVGVLVDRAVAELADAVADSLSS
jgi:hypothetical protein